MRLYMDNLDQSTTERDVRKFFTDYGRVTSVVIKSGYGFVTIEDDHDARDAINDLSGRSLNGRSVHIEQALREVDGRKTKNRLLIRNLSTACDSEALRARMISCGNVTYVSAHDRTKKTGFVCFESRAAVLRAIEKYQGADVNGRPMLLIDMSFDIDKPPSVSSHRSCDIIEISSSPPRLSGRAPFRKQPPLRQVPSIESPAGSRAKRRRQPSSSPSRSSLQAKRRREDGGGRFDRGRGVGRRADDLRPNGHFGGQRARHEQGAGEVQPDTGRPRGGRQRAQERFSRKQTDMHRDSQGSLKRPFHTSLPIAEKPDRRETTLPWDGNKASFLPTLSSQLPVPVGRERSKDRRREEEDHQRQAFPTVWRGRGRGGVTRRTADSSLSRIHASEGLHQEERRAQEQEEHSRREEESRQRQEFPTVWRGRGQGGVTQHTAEHSRCEEESHQRQEFPTVWRGRGRGGVTQHTAEHNRREEVSSQRPELPPVGRGAGMIGKSRGGPISQRVIEPVTEVQPVVWPEWMRGVLPNAEQGPHSSKRGSGEEVTSGGGGKQSATRGEETNKSRAVIEPKRGGFGAGRRGKLDAEAKKQQPSSQKSADEMPRPSIANASRNSL